MATVKKIAGQKFIDMSEDNMIDSLLPKLDKLIEQYKKEQAQKKSPTRAQSDDASGVKPYHGDHDQSSHGNWADGITDSDVESLLTESEKLEAEWNKLNSSLRGDATLTPEERELQALNARTWGNNPLTEAEEKRRAELQAAVGVSLQEKVKDQNTLQWMKSIQARRDVIAGKLDNDTLNKFTTAREDTVDRVARVLGVPSGTDTSYGGRGYKFSVGGDDYIAAGQFDPATNKITIYDGAFSSGGLSAGVVAHELQHAKFHQWREQATKEHRQLVSLDGDEQAKYWKENDYQRTLTPEGEKKFPYYASWKKFRDDDFQEQLEKADGITPYSTSYWKDYNAGGTFERAVNETLAEVARLKVDGKTAEIAPIWKELQERLNALTY